jgi:hypothetical protein
LEEEMVSPAGLLEEPTIAGAPLEQAEPSVTYRLRPIMRQGTASSIPETWERYATLADARLAAKRMYHDDRVLRAFAVTDQAPPQFVEWIER